MTKIFQNILLILIISISNKAISMNSSSYLVANMAVNLLDFDMAYLQFSKSNMKLNESDLHKKMLTFVSLDLINEAKEVSTKIIELNQFNQEAWIVYLTNAKIQKTTYENGAFVRVGGHNIMMSPPLIVTEDHVNKIISALEAGIKSV